MWEVDAGGGGARGWVGMTWAREWRGGACGMALCAVFG